MVTAIDCVISERIEFENLRAAECRRVALLLQLEAPVVDAAGSVDREHQRQCDFGFLRSRRRLGLRWRRSEEGGQRDGRPHYFPVHALSRGSSRVALPLAMAVRSAAGRLSCRKLSIWLSGKYG